MNEQLLTINDLSKKLRIGRTKIYYLVREGELKPIRVGRRVLFPATYIEKWIKEKIESEHGDES